MTTKPGKNMSTRIIAVMVALIVLFTGLSGGRLSYIMIVKGDFYQTKASEQQLYDNLVTAPRGDIYDRNMNRLATSSTAWTVYLTPNGINKLKDAEEAEKVRKKISEGLSVILDMPYDEIYEKTTQNRYYVIVKKKIEKETTDKIREFLANDENNTITKPINNPNSHQHTPENQIFCTTPLSHKNALIKYVITKHTQ